MRVCRFWGICRSERGRGATGLLVFKWSLVVHLLAESRRLSMRILQACAFCVRGLTNAQRRRWRWPTDCTPLRSVVRPSLRQSAPVPSAVPRPKAIATGLYLGRRGEALARCAGFQRLHQRGEGFGVDLIGQAALVIELLRGGAHQNLWSG